MQAACLLSWIHVDSKGALMVLLSYEYVPGLGRSQTRRCIDWQVPESLLLKGAGIY
jgi:hypothetical protein